MPDFRDRIKDFCVGDDLELRCKVTRIPSGQTVIDAWCTVKADPEDSDAAAIFQKHITAVNVAGVGQIESDGSSGTAVLRFDWTREDTLLLEPDGVYYHDVQVKTSADKISTPFKGLTFPKGQITISE